MLARIKTDIPLTIRADYDFNEKTVFKQISLMNSVIVTDKKLDINTISYLKKNIHFLIMKVDNEDFVEYSKQLLKLGIRIDFFSESPQEMGNLKLRYMDIGIVKERQKFSKEKMANTHLIGDNTYVRTNRALLSNDKVYLSKVHWQHKIECENLQQLHAPIVDTAEFWEDADKYWIYNQL